VLLRAIVAPVMLVAAAALGVDYNIFLSARIREESRQLGLRHGTLRALGVTGGVGTAVGLIMAACLGDLVSIAAVSTGQVAMAIAIGVLLDTLLMRTVLVPASLLAVGERVWWPARSTRPEQRGTKAAGRLDPGLRLARHHTGDSNERL
jgi:putative drug exporter of the RND superfamily